MAFGHRIVSIVISPAFQFETNVLTDNVYLTSRELSARIPLLHSWLFICNNNVFFLLLLFLFFSISASRCPVM